MQAHHFYVTEHGMGINCSGSVIFRWSSSNTRTASTCSHIYYLSMDDRVNNKIINYTVMMHKLFKWLLGLIIAFACFTASAQSYNMPSGTTTACSGTFYDPGGTGNYTDSWPPLTAVSTFTSGNTQMIRFDFTQFNLEFNDWLFIHDGPTTASPVIVSYTGSQSPFTVISSGSTLTFRLVLNGNGWTGSGWEASISCVGAQTTNTFVLASNTAAVTVPCGGTSDFYDRGGPVYNYPPAVASYVTTYSASAGQTLQFSFDQFDTELYGDWLYVYDGNSTAAPLIGQYSGSTILPLIITSSGSDLTFRFVDNGNGSAGTGWHASVTCSPSQGANTYFMGNSTAPVAIPCGITSKIYDQGGPTNNYYASGTAYTHATTYTAPPGQTLNVAFSSLYTEYNGDWLYIYDGTSTAAPLIGQFGGIYGVPFNVTSSGDALTFVFTVNTNGSVGSGWEADISCSATQGPSTFALSNSAQPVAIPCGAVSTLYDLGGPTNNYMTMGSSQIYTTTYTANAGQYIQLVFNSLMLDYPNDRLNIYDGPSTSSPLIGQYTGGQNVPFTITSTSDTITIQFVENGNVSNSGWSADISCVPALGPSSFVINSSGSNVNVSCSGTSYFYDPGGQQNNYMDPGAIQSYTTTYTSLTGQALQFIFNSFCTSASDILYAYDGTTTADPVLATLSGTPAVPFTITSSATNSITFRFVTNGNWNICSGWEAQVGCIGLPLPVKLLKFEAEAHNEKVNLDWTTASETNNDYFTIERSADGISFNPIGTVDGAGNSTSALNYSFVDNGPLPGVSYYRLRQTDFNGHYSYSNIEAVSFEGVEILSVFPNPATDQLSFLLGSSDESDVNIEIIDKLGRILHSEIQHIEEAVTEYAINVSSYNAGVYLIRISTTDNSHFTQKQFVK